MSLSHLLFGDISLGMLRLVDSVIARATSHKAFNTNLPLLDTSIKEVIGVANVFSSVLFEFFVMVQPFEERGIKSIVIKGLVP